MKIFLCFSSIFTSVRLVSHSPGVFRFLKRKILITFNAEENTRAFERLKHYLEQEIQEILKSFTIKRNKKEFTRIFG